MSGNSDEEIRRLKEELAAAKKQLALADDFHKAFMWNSIAHFTWDYTTGIVEEEVYLKTPQGTVGLSEMTGVALPASIDEITSAFADKFVSPDWAGWYKANFSQKFALTNFEELGPYNLAFERKLISGDFGAQYARFEAPVTKDPDTGHVIARFNMTDCSNRYHLVAPVEFKDVDTARVALLAALKRVFLFVAHANLGNMKYNVLSASEAIDSLMLQKKPASIQDMRGVLANVLPEAEQQKFLEFSDMNTMRERLQQNQTLSCEFITVDEKHVLASIIPIDTDYFKKDVENARYYNKFYSDYGDGEHDLAGDVIFTVLDVTEQRQYEKRLQEAEQSAQAANEAKTSFLFNMSHDIRTPMNAIVGYTELMEKHLDNPVKLADYLRKVRSSGDLLLELINNVLEMARIESGAMVLDETTWDAYVMNDSLFDVLDEQVKAKRITFERSIDVQHRYVYCDSLKLREIFLNILSNAYKYTPEGGSVRMDLVEIPSDKEGCALYHMTVADTGIGMAADYLPHIFDEFSRERTATESQVQGTGLGLSIVKKLVKLMDGRISVESELGKGTTFTVELYHKISSKEALEKPDELQLEQADFTGKRILLAEDNELNAEIATEILEEAGVEVEWASDGIIAVDMLAKAPAGHYDFVLMDIQMPNLDGYGATKRIRALDDSAKANIPVVAMTANAFEEDKQNAIAAGMNGHLAKPVDIDELMQVLNTYLA